MGEVMFRGNVVMRATSRKRRDGEVGWRGRLVPFRATLASSKRKAMEAQDRSEGYHYLRREKHSSIEVRSAFDHPGVQLAAVGWRGPTEKWGDALRLSR